MKGPRKLLKLSLCLLILPLVYSPLSSFCQNYISPIDKKIDSLRKNGIDSILRYGRSGEAWIVNYSNFTIFSSDYLIWREEKNINIQKFSICFNEDGSRSFDTAFTVIILENNAAYLYFVENLDSLFYQRLKPALFREIKGKDTVMVEEPSRRNDKGITYYIKDSKYQRFYDETQTWDGTIRNDDGSIRAKKESLNYGYNISTAIVQLVKFLESTVLILEDNKAFGH